MDFDDPKGGCNEFATNSSFEFRQRKRKAIPTPTKTKKVGIAWGSTLRRRSRPNLSPDLISVFWNGMNSRREERSEV
jgi:hypothetical protein